MNQKFYSKSTMELSQLHLLLNLSNDSCYIQKILTKTTIKPMARNDIMFSGGLTS